jgi:hypothetical protein
LWGLAIDADSVARYHFYAISVECKASHPVVAAVMTQAVEPLFAAETIN